MTADFSSFVKCRTQRGPNHLSLFLDRRFVEFTTYLYSMELTSLPDEPGVFIVLVESFWVVTPNTSLGVTTFTDLPHIDIVDVDVASSIRDQVQNHSRRKCWEEKCNALSNETHTNVATLLIGVLVEKNESVCKEIAAEVRERCKPLCTPPENPNDS